MVYNPKAAVRAARQIGYPVVVKPLDANHGRGVSINLVEEKITIFFEVIEVIMDFNWKGGSKNLTRLEQLNIAYEDFSPLKTMSNLDSNRKIRGTPIHQLYDFLTSVYEFVSSLLSKIHRQLLKIYQELNTDLFDIF